MKIAQIYYYEPQSARINVQSPQSESTPRRLTLGSLQKLRLHLGVGRWSEKC
jgi:hypothetical protein